MKKIVNFLSFYSLALVDVIQQCNCSLHREYHVCRVNNTNYNVCFMYKYKYSSGLKVDRTQQYFESESCIYEKEK